jgi:hypothetical protein
MNITTHTLPDAQPVVTGWVDGALATVYGTGDPLGAIVGWPLGGGEDPALLTGADQVGICRLVHADLPLGDSAEARPEEIPT